ncbi:hypothetical protein G7046_g8692 [Stylonectria norvegica]|nr:hypothetical protein G7046_g8692 [Stylonectria norvegica]
MADDGRDILDNPRQLSTARSRRGNASIAAGVNMWGAAHSVTVSRQRCLATSPFGDIQRAQRRPFSWFKQQLRHYRKPSPALPPTQHQAKQPSRTSTRLDAIPACHPLLSALFPLNPARHRLSSAFHVPRSLRESAG